MIRTDTETTTNSAIRVPAMTAGSRLPAGCILTTEVAIR